MSDHAQVGNFVNNLQVNVFRKWGELSPEDRRMKSIAAIGPILGACGVTALPTPMAVVGNDLGSFRAQKWGIAVTSAFFRRAAPTPQDLQELACTLYHEFRHCEQHFAMARFEMQRARETVRRSREVSGETGRVKALNADLLAPAADEAIAFTGGLVPRWVFLKAAARPLLRNDPLFPLVKEWCDQKYDRYPAMLNYDIGVEAVRLRSHQALHPRQAAPVSTTPFTAPPMTATVRQKVSAFERGVRNSMADAVRMATVDATLRDIEASITTCYTRRYTHYSEGIPTERDAHAIEKLVEQALKTRPFVLNGTR